MKEAAQNSKCIIAIVTGSHVRRESVSAVGERPELNAYFNRPYCVSELRWAREVGVPIQPVVRMGDKQRIGELLGFAPPDLKDLGATTDFIHLDRSRPEFWEAGIGVVLRNIENPAAGVESEYRTSLAASKAAE